jgi:hypothetical protein
MVHANQRSGSHMVLSCFVGPNRNIVLYRPHQVRRIFTSLKKNFTKLFDMLGNSIEVANSLSLQNKDLMSFTSKPKLVQETEHFNV